MPQSSGNGNQRTLAFHASEALSAAMTLTLHFHPLSSFCHKALIAAYELDVPFEPLIVDLGDQPARDRLAQIWPLQKVPVLVDSERGATVAESTTIIEYLDTFHREAGHRGLVPKDPDQAWQARMWDRVFDGYVDLPMQSIVGNALRPDGERDAYGVARAQATIAKAYAFLRSQIHGPWMLGDAFTLADCSAAPALFYAELAQPFGPEDAPLAAYLDRLKRRPSFERVLAEAEPYFGLFPLPGKPSRFPTSG